MQLRKFKYPNPTFVSLRIPFWDILFNRYAIMFLPIPLLKSHASEFKEIIDTALKRKGYEREGLILTIDENGDYSWLVIVRI